MLAKRANKLELRNESYYAQYCKVNKKINVSFSLESIFKNIY